MEQHVERFEVGSVYYCRSGYDWDCKIFFKVLNRTAKTVTLRNIEFDLMGNETQGGWRDDATCRVKVNTNFSFVDAGDSTHELVMPLGRYAEAPVLTAQPYRKVA
tara:strand:+ start:126 stop:440 length:315 start_codon:yes stop_codon:yes gene_type:complete